MRAQLESFPSLLAARDRRHSPVSGLLLTNGDLDHCLGLLSLRESYPLVVYATESVRDGFTSGNVLYRTLERFAEQVTWRTLAVGREQQLGDTALSGDGRGDAGQAAAAPGRNLARRRPDDNVGLVIRDSRTEPRRSPISRASPGRRPALVRAVTDADLVFFDGTFWSSDELIALGLGHAARRGDGALADRRAGRQPAVSVAPARPARLDSHQQHQPHLARGEPRAARRSRRPASRSRADGLEVTL